MNRIYDFKGYQIALLLLTGKKIWNFQSNSLRILTSKRTYLFFLRIVMLTAVSVCFLPSL